MKNLKLKNYTYLLVSLSGIIWILLGIKENLEVTQWKDFISLVPKVVTVDMIFIAIFIKWGWKSKFVRGWLVPYPNLNGTWTGYIHSDWKNPKTGEGVDPIPAMLTIYQDFLSINCKMYTGEMKSYSMSEGFTVDIEKQIKQLSYIYTSTPRPILSERSNAHVGSMVFDIIEKKERKLKGHYWTNRETKGEIILKFADKELFDEIPSQFENHPVTEEKHVR